MQAMNQISGINVTSYYMSYIFINALGISELLSRILAAAGSVDYLIFSILAYFVIERYGRRKVMMTSAAACSFCWIMISIALGLSANGADSYKMGILAVSFFFVFFASFGMGVLGVPWLYPTEINALEMRTKGASLGKFSYCFQCTKLILISDGDKLDLQLRSRTSDFARNCQPRLEVLDHLGSHLLRVHSHHLSILPGDCQQV